MNKKIFISYSHQNMEWAQENGYNLLPWLESQLAPEGISVWWDKDMTRMPGIEYEQRIYSKIDEADLAILLISQEYAVSSFIRDKEEPRIKARYERGELMIIPLMISPVSNMYKNNRLSWIFDLQIFPEATKPLIDIVKDKSKWESTKVNLLDGIYNRLKYFNIPNDKTFSINNYSDLEIVELQKSIQLLKDENSIIKGRFIKDKYKIRITDFFLPPYLLYKTTKLFRDVKKDNPDALYYLGYCYEYGTLDLGIAINIDMAIKYYQQAAKLGHNEAQESLKRLGKSW